MDLATLENINTELEQFLLGRRFGKIFSLSRFEMAIDFRLQNSNYLFISIEPSNPRIYLIRRRVRDLEKQSTNASAFIAYLVKRLSGSTLDAITQLPGERILRFDFSGVNEIGEGFRHSLIIQLTGKSANLFLLDSNLRILESARPSKGTDPEANIVYSPPIRATKESNVQSKRITAEMHESLSETLDSYYTEKAAEKQFESLANAARNKLKQEISKREKLIRNLTGDLRGHGDADKWKRYGDLLLSNIATAKRSGDKIIVTDYFDENLAEVEIEADENDSLTESAEKYFKRYTKARNAREEIAGRMEIVRNELEKILTRKENLEKAIAEKDEESLTEFVSGGKRSLEKKRGKQKDTSSGNRSFVSSDGFEILVGKKAKDNDYLTFRIAKSLDLWMHAADYPGSHVVIRNPNRKEIPHQTLLEAAQLAAFYSQGKSQPKAAVHYTQKKFVNKPKGAAPGLVSLAGFKTILVEPKIGTPEKSGLQ